MKKGKAVRNVLGAAAALAILALLGMTLLPSAVPVQVAHVARGPLRVTVDEEGETRAHDRFVVAAPVPGRLLRVELDDGDAVVRNQTVALLDPQPLSQRERQEVLARVEAAEAAMRAADARVEHARADYEQARRDRQRAEALARDGIIATQVSEQAQNADLTSAKEFEAATHSAQAALHEVRVARAGLVALEAESGSPRQLIPVHSPVAGRVLRVLEKSERVVAAGTPLVVIGDPEKIEVVADVLSTEAVKIRPRAEVLFEAWGGEQPLRGSVRLVEPGGFMKVSALGIEEQRVNVVSDFLDPPGSLGDGYRVEVRITVWAGEQVLNVPSSAVYRRGQTWCVFAVEAGRARQREVLVGHRGATEVEILSGIEEGTLVILHPSNRIQDGVRVRPD